VNGGYLNEPYLVHCTKEGAYIVIEIEEARTVKEAVAWQLARAMKDKKISKNRMAALLGTSRTQVDRLLNAKDDITLGSLQRAAAILGRQLRIELVGGDPTPEKRDINTRRSSSGRDAPASDMEHPQVEVLEESGWLG
jgi:transcriptional regulator with XRE-family HTH domain